jgi:integrase
VIENDGRLVGTRTPDLYRVKGQLTNTLNNLESDGDRLSTPKYVQDRVSTVRRAVRSFLAVVYTLYAKPHDWIFPSTKMKGRTPLSASTMAKDNIRPAAIKIGILLEPGQQFGFHNFRHSLATFLINKGKDLDRVSRAQRTLI